MTGEKNRLKEILKQQGHTQKWLADQLGTYDSTVRHWSRGTFNPSVATLRRIAQLLNVSMDELYLPPAEEKKLYIKFGLYPKPKKK